MICSIFVCVHAPHACVVLGYNILPTLHCSSLDAGCTKCHSMWYLSSHAQMLLIHGLHSKPGCVWLAGADVTHPTGFNKSEPSIAALVCPVHVVSEDSRFAMLTKPSACTNQPSL